MKDLFFDEPTLRDPGAWDPPTPAALLADTLLTEHAALAAADEALAEATRARAVVLGRERAARDALSTAMAIEGLKRIDRPRGTVVEIGARMRAGEGDEHTVIALASLRVLPRRVAEDPLFVPREVEPAPTRPNLAKIATPPDDEQPASERRRRTA